MISCTYGDIKNENKLVKSMDERNVDGIFIVSASRKNQQHHVKHRQKPLVFLDRDFSVSNAICVASDNCDSGAQLTKAMIQQDAPIHFLPVMPFFLLLQPVCAVMFRRLKLIMVMKAM